MKYDVVLYGATGFTGRLTAKYLDRAPDLKGHRAVGEATPGAGQQPAAV